MKLLARIRLLAIILVASPLPIVLSACGPSIEVESNTDWQGYVSKTSDLSTAGKSVQGTGKQTFEGYNCGTFQLRTAEPGTWLRAKVVRKGILAPDGEEDATNAPYGVVSVCGE